MDFPKRAPQQGSPRRSQRAMRPGGATEADENAGPTRPVPAGNASPLRKKVFRERNGGGEGVEAATPAPQPKSVPSPPSLTGRSTGAYDPKTNYTTPRPEFLRYDPERHREMLLRLARAAEVAEEEDCSSGASGTAPSDASGSSVSSAPGSDSHDGDDDEEEEEVVPPGRGRWARRLFLLLVSVACWFCYIYCMDPTPFPLHSEDSLDFTGPIGGVYDAGVYELDTLRLLGLGPLYMMGPEEVVEETASPIVQGGNEGIVHQYDQRAASRIWMTIEMMGLVDICPSVHLGESTCRIGDENNENVDDLMESSKLSEHNAAVMMGSFENDAQNISWPPIGSTSTQTVDAEGGSSGLVHQEEQEYSNQFVPQQGSVEKAIGSASGKLDRRMGLESEGLDLETELWQYEQTAEAAKEMCTKVKFPWSAMEPHLFQVLACLSGAGFVATMFKYYPRSGEIAVPTSQEMSSKSLKEVPVLVPHQIEQLPVPKQDLSRSLEVPMKLPLPKSGPSVSLKAAPMVYPGNRVQKLQKGDAETTKASHGNSQYHRDNDISKPPGGRTAWRVHYWR